MSAETLGKKTPFYEIHLSKEAKLVNFNGWALPVQYQGIIEEVNMTRENATIFDVSHMGEILVEGQNSIAYLQRMLTNDISILMPNKAQYTLLCNKEGGVIDDLLVYRLKEDKFWLVVNAANKDKDLKWLKDNVENDSGVIIRDESDLTGQIALQGPKAKNLLNELLEEEKTGCQIETLSSFAFEKTEISEINVLISRTGYTGEDGFELYMPTDKGSIIWNKIEKFGEKYRLTPAGLGARDVLRLEASLPLYGQELSENISPLEAGLGSFVKFDTSFMGKEALEKQKLEGIEKKLVGFKMEGRRIPRSGYELYAQGERVGEITSGSFSPTIGKPVGMGYVHEDMAFVGNEIDVKIRKDHDKAVIVKTPFYRRR